jgi:hypothetical protein
MNVAFLRNHVHRRGRRENLTDARRSLRALRYRELLTAAGFVAIVAAISPSLSAQWPPYPTAGVPRTRGGQPDLTAPAPRTSDGKPDLSGIWENVRGFGQGKLSGGVGGAAGAPLADGTIPPRANQFWDISWGLKDGLPLQPWARELLKKRMADNSKDNPDAHCLPMGLLQFHNHPQPRKIIQTPKVIVILYEGNAGIRQIFMDGRPLPRNDPQPWWYGYSTGRWDGDTLVVETSGLRDGGWLDINGTPLTDAAKLTERLRRVNYGNLEIEVTVDDPKAYTKPWTVKIHQRIMLDTELIEFVCAENEKSTQYFDK